MRVARQIRLSRHEKETLARWESGDGTSSRLSKRARMVLLAAEGRTNKEIATEVGTDRQTVSRWRSRFAEQRLDGIRDDAPRSGRPATLREKATRVVLQKALPPRPAYPAEHSVRTLADQLGLSPSLVHRILRDNGLTWLWLKRSSRVPRHKPSALDPHRVKSQLRWPGGKTLLFKRLAAFFPAHTSYREPFVGGGSVFFAKRLAARSHLNDAHPAVFAYYTALREHFDQFAGLLRQQKGDLRDVFENWCSRRDLMQFTGESKKHLVERAVQCFALNKLCWAGRILFDPSRTQQLYFSRPKRLKRLDERLPHLKRVSAKLQGVRITCRDFEACLKGATEDTFVYADPPYLRQTFSRVAVRLYDRNFTLADHHRLAEALHSTRAKVMLSYDDDEHIKRLYRDWTIVPVENRCSGRYDLTPATKKAGRKVNKPKVTELILLNYDPT